MNILSGGFTYGSSDLFADLPQERMNILSGGLTFRLIISLCGFTAGDVPWIDCNKLKTICEHSSED